MFGLDLPWAYLCTCLVIALPKGWTGALPGISGQGGAAAGGAVAGAFGLELARTRGTE